MRRLERDGVALFCDEAGDGEPPILLVHGWCGDHTYMAPQFEHFRRQHRTVAVDLRGHGRSDKPEQEYTIAGFADDLAWLCGQIGLGRPVVIGHSMGGFVALELAARSPALVTAVVVLDASIALDASGRQARRALAEGLRGPGYRDAARRIVEAMCLPTDNAARRARIVASVAAVPAHVMASTWANTFTYDSLEAVRACRVPALYIGAAVARADVARFRELCPQLVTGQTVGAGHFHQLEVPEQVNAMIERFLAVALPKAAAL